MIKINKTVLALSLTAIMSSSVTAQEGAGSVVAQGIASDAIKEVNKQDSISTILEINVGNVTRDTLERSALKTKQDVNQNRTAAYQSTVDMLEVKAEVERREYIEKNVPIEVRVHGRDASLAWIDKNESQQQQKAGKSIVWASSTDNLYVPISKTSKKADSPVSSEGLTDKDIEKLKAMGLVVPGSENQNKTDEQPEPKQTQTQTQTERTFISPVGVSADRVVIMGENKHITGTVNFEISLTKGKEAASHRLTRSKIGDKFFVNGVGFVLGDIKESEVTIINLDNSEVARFNI
tara:strand:+ start:11047 stop:11925 length:879 start_codon:yes stop_codon:yes gene_type:complete